MAKRKPRNSSPNRGDRGGRDDGGAHSARSSNHAGGTRDVEVAYGFHSVEALVDQTPSRLIEVVIDDSRMDSRGKDLLTKMATQKINHRTVSKEELDDYAFGAVHQGVVAILKPAPLRDEADLYVHLDALNHPLLILVLDQIQDPHNLGACIRTADGAGVDAVVVPKNGACPVNQTVRKVAAGAADRVNIFYVTNLARTLDDLAQRGVWLTGATDKSDKHLYHCDLKGNVAIAMGSEGKGLRRLTLEKCDQLASIPMHGSVSSLNVSVATGVFLFEAARQRLA